MNTRFRSARSFAERANPQSRLANAARMMITSDPDVWLYRMVVIMLGATVLACVIGAVVLALADKSIPEFLVALASAAAGGLAGLLVPSPKRKE